ncbi:PDZ domain-containing protein [soil metagenome]
MKALIKPFLFLLTFGTATGLLAQDEKVATTEKRQSDVIIRKKGDSKEKMTIIIDGDKVTVNGKPVEDYKNDDLEIIHNDDMFEAPFPPAMAFAPQPGFNVMNEDFMREIHSNKAFLGVMTKKVSDGAEITEVTKESAAEKAGFKVGDIITKVNDDKIADADDLYQTIGKYKPEDKVTVTYKRAGKENKATVTLGENKQVKVFSWNNGNDNMDENFKFDMRTAPRVQGYGNSFNGMWPRKPRLGLQVQETEDSKGVKVLDVDEDEPAGKAGIEEDDIITSINGKAVSSLETLKETMKDVKDGDTLKFDILRDGKAQTISVKFPKELKTTDL